MKNRYNILVTGCGGDIGQSIGKILLESDYVNNLFGIDISDKNAGKFIFERFHLGPRCSNENYIQFLENFVKENKIDVVIPVSEPELRFLSKNEILDEIGGAKLITASLFALQIGFDKLKTAQFLEENKLPFPISDSIDEVEEVKFFPVILKSKTGSGSSQVYRVEDAESFNWIKAHNSDFVVQEYIDGAKGEFTCGLFRSKAGDTRNIILKRELMGGFSGYGEVVENKEIENLLNVIGDRLKLEGSINVQLRLVEKGPLVFEINPRFSSTVRFRQMLAFNDLEWSIEDKLGIPLSDYDPNSVGRKFYKGFNEYIA